jgi:uncharacterized membrane protein YfcA
MEFGNLGIWLLVALAGAAAQMVDGMLGMGFGAFSSIIMIAIGVDPVIAVGTVNLAKIGSGLFSGLSHWRFGNAKRRWMLPLIISGVLGAVVGAMLLSQIPSQMARIWVPLILLVTGIVILVRFWLRSGGLPAVAGGSNGSFALTSQKVERKLLALPSRLPTFLRVGAVGSLAGALGGFSGAYGPFATSLLMMATKGHPRFAVGTVNLAEFFVAIAVTVTIFLRVGSGRMTWELALALFIGSSLTAPLAAYISRRLPAKSMGLAVGTALVGLNLWALSKAFS